MIGANEREAAEEVHHLVRSFTPPLTLQCVVSVAGVLEFFGSELGRRFDPGKTYRVLRPPAVLAGAAKRSARLQIFDRHPHDVDPNTAAEDEVLQYVVGHASGLSLAGLRLFARVVIWRPDAIAAIKRGKRSALSISYRQYLTIEGGRFNGDQYDAVAHEIELSNIALVESSRAGAAVRIRWSDHAEQ